jgi:tight adherence protein C
MFVFIVCALTLATVTTLVMSGYHFLMAESPAAERLRQLVPGAGQRKPAAARPQRSLVQQMLAVLGQYSLGGSENSLQQTLSVAGIRAGNAAALFLGVRTLLSFGPAVLILVVRISTGQPIGRTLQLAALAWAAGHVLPNSWLKRRARRRVQQITETLPDCLDLLVVCLEAGLGLHAAIDRLGKERSAMNDPLGAEFKRVARELGEGRARDEALRALGERNGVLDLKALTALIVQSERLGASLGKTLRAHADLLRTKRRQRAEEAARKLPIKMLFPLALFILPSLLIMVGGPALIGIKSLVRVITQG